MANVAGFTGGQGTLISERFPPVACAARPRPSRQSRPAFPQVLFTVSVPRRLRDHRQC